MAHQSQSNTQGSRDFLKCDQCRKEHKKCFPRDRDWNGQQQKCNRCHRLGHPCGPQMRKKRSTPADNNGTIESPRLLRRHSPRYDSIATNVVDAATSRSRPLDTWSTPEGSMCLDSLAAIVSAHEFLLSRLLFLNGRNASSRSELTRMKHVSDMISNMIGELHRTFKAESRLVQTRISAAKGFEAQLLGLKMAYYDERHYSLRKVKSPQEAQAYVSQRNRRAAFISHDADEARILSCTSRVLPDSYMEPRTQSERSGSNIQDYVLLESRMRSLSQEIQDVDTDDTSSMMSTWPDRTNPQLLNPFPASHIAYFNQDREVALDLWKQPHDHSSGIDIFERSFIHIVAASQDLGTMKKIVIHAPDTVKHAYGDIFGLNPIDLVNGSSSNPIRILLREAGAKSVSDQHRVQPRTLPVNLARFTDAQDCPQLSSRLQNNDFLTSTPTETLQDLNGIHIYTPDAQMLDDEGVGNPMDFNQYSTMDQTFRYDNYMCGQGNMFQSTQSSIDQARVNSSNIVHVMPSSQFLSSHDYNPYRTPR